MESRVLFFLLGFGLMVVGCTYVITYLNLLTVGYTWKEYWLFLFHHLECWFVLFGFFFITLSIYWKGGRKSDLHL